MPSLMSLIKQAGFRGQAANIMYAIVMAESGGRAHAFNGNSGTGDQSYGLAQINMIGGLGPARRAQFHLSSNEALFDPLTNLKVAYALSNGGRDFSPWTTYTRGTYQQFMGQNGARVDTSGAVPQGTGGDGGGGGTSAPTSADFKSALGELGAALQTVPEIRQQIERAITGGWSVDKFLQAVHGTKWWRTHNQAARELFGLKFADPQEYATRIRNASNQVVNMAAQLGITLRDPNHINALAHQFLINGWDQQTLLTQLGKLFNPLANTPLSGAIGSAYQQLKDMFGQYGLPMAESTLRYRALQMAENTQSIDSYKTLAVNAAKSMYPSLAAQLDSGMTVRDIADPYIQTMAHLLELDPQSINLMDPMIKRALQGSITNDGSGKATATSTPIWQFESQLRSDPRWAKTQNARDTISSALVKIGQDFGFSA